MYRRTGMENALSYKVMPTELVILPNGHYFFVVRVGVNPIDILGVRYLTEAVAFDSAWFSCTNVPSGGFIATGFPLDITRGVNTGTTFAAYHSAQANLPSTGSQRTPTAQRNITTLPLRITEGVVSQGLRLAANNDYVLRIQNRDNVNRVVMVEVEYLEYGNAN